MRGPGGPIGGADVVVNDAGGDRMQDVTDGLGRARLRGLTDGHHTVYVNAPGHVPAVGRAEIVDGTGTLTVDMEQGALAAADVEAHELSEEEIRDAGIDPDDPANEQVFDTTREPVLLGLR